MNIKRAHYVSVWDDGSTEIITNCLVDLDNNTVFNVETTDEEIEDCDCLTREYIEIIETGEIIERDKFILEDFDDEFEQYRAQYEGINLFNI